LGQTLVEPGWYARLAAGEDGAVEIGMKCFVTQAPHQPQMIYAHHIGVLLFEARYLPECLIDRAKQLRRHLVLVNLLQLLPPGLEVIEQFRVVRMDLAQLVAQALEIATADNLILLRIEERGIENVVAASLDQFVILLQRLREQDRRRPRCLAARRETAGVRS